MMPSFVCLIICLAFSFSLIVQARQITFINSCNFPLEVDASGSTICSLSSQGTCTWAIPSGGWSGRFYRHNTYGGISGYPSATLAEFNLASECPSCQWNYDWYDISIIPPGCSGSSISYSECVQWTNPPGVTTNDGYDVGMEMYPVLCPSQSRVCDGKGCSGAYGFPNDNSKTSACTQLGDWQVTFCPPGSYVDLTSAQMALPGEIAVSSPPGYMTTGAAIGIGVSIGVIFTVLSVVVVVFWLRNRNSLEVI